jgi:PPOX class probable F420-dependent enzyme
VYHRAPEVEMSRRAQIRMTPQEADAFLAGSKTMILCSIGPDGVPHPMPMWFGVEPDGAIVMTTFTKSQKIRNLERDPRVSLLVEAGEQYAELQGLLIYGSAELVPETERVVDILITVTKRSGGIPEGAEQAARAGILSTAKKRTGIRVRPGHVVSWDHRKLGGTY